MDITFSAFHTKSDAESQCTSSHSPVFETNLLEFKNKWRPRRCHADAPVGVRTMATNCQETVGYRTYRLRNKVMKYDENVFNNISEIAKGMTALMKLRIVYPIDCLQIIWNLFRFILTWSRKSIHEGSGIRQSAFTQGSQNQQYLERSWLPSAGCRQEFFLSLVPPRYLHTYKLSTTYYAPMPLMKILQTGTTRYTRISRSPNETYGSMLSSWLRWYSDV